jgi:hypothetical protein
MSEILRAEVVSAIFGLQAAVPSPSNPLALPLTHAARYAARYRPSRQSPMPPRQVTDKRPCRQGSRSASEPRGGVTFPCRQPARHPPTDTTPVPTHSRTSLQETTARCNDNSAGEAMKPWGHILICEFPSFPSSGLRTSCPGSSSFHSGPHIVLAPLPSLCHPWSMPRRRSPPEW